MKRKSNNSNNNEKACFAEVCGARREPFSFFTKLKLSLKGTDLEIIFSARIIFEALTF